MHITSNPKGDTLNVNKRSSDTYARLYDKASESGEGVPRTRWRYEVEHKRSVARRVAAMLDGCESLEVSARSVVFDYFDARGVAPIFTKAGQSETQSPRSARAKTSVLDWFRDSLSITVARAIQQHGSLAVVDALGLRYLVDSDNERMM